MLEQVANYLAHPHDYIPLVIAAGVYVLLWIFKNVLVTRLKKISAETETYVDDVILLTLDKTKQWFMVCTSLYSGFQASPFDTKEYGPVADKLFIILTAVQVTIWGFQTIGSSFDFALKKKNDDPSVKTTFGFMRILAKMAFAVTVFLFGLNNLGIDVTTFVAGLGVGGIAIALATQNILGDLFSSLSIVMDKPFIVGDYINLGEWQGTVEHVGLKTTRIRSLSGEQIIISNSGLLSSKIRNHKRMVERRVAFQLGVTYEVRREALIKAPGLIEEIIRKEDKARFERAHFIRFGSYSLDYEVVYWVTTPEYMEYADIHQRVLFAIHEAFERNGLEFAYPTQKLFLKETET